MGSTGLSYSVIKNFEQAGALSTHLVANVIDAAAAQDSSVISKCMLHAEVIMKALLSRLMSVLAVLALVQSMPVTAQGVRQVDPNDIVTSDSVLTKSAEVRPVAEAATAASVTGPMDVSDAVIANASATTAPGAVPGTPTYRRDDVIGAAEGVFGKGAKGLGEILEKILKDQGEPNAYIAGREVSAAIGIGLRYGSGTMSHTVEGSRPVYWTGPSLGFDLGGDATKTFVLVYNLYDGQDLYRRYPQVEGRAYFVGGFSATYLRRGNVALIPVRLGVGVRLGANVGYMKFSEKSKWLPF